MTPHSAVPTIDALRDKRGRFSMLAIDQRESMRQMIARAAGRDSASDDELVAFKLAVSRTLSPYASATLLDHTYGSLAAEASVCPVILAADILHQDVPGGPVTRAELDPVVDAALVEQVGAIALKMLVPWLPDKRDAAVSLSAQFMDLCRSLGMLGIVEGVVRPADIATWSHAKLNDALVTAAQDLAPTLPDLYKAEVPQFGVGDPISIVETARRITESVDCPWVVLSSGVTADNFPAAVKLSIEGGASGFLAGRAIWADAIAAPNPEAFLASESSVRLQRIASAE
jgi:sulfofructosephosphate aldolase